MLGDFEAQAGMRKTEVNQTYVHPVSSNCGSWHTGGNKFSLHEPLTFKNSYQIRLKIP